MSEVSTDKIPITVIHAPGLRGAFHSSHEAFAAGQIIEQHLPEGAAFAMIVSGRDGGFPNILTNVNRKSMEKLWKIGERMIHPIPADIIKK